MAHFTAKMQHNEKTIIKLVETQQKVFQFGRRAAYFIVAGILIFYGLYADKSMLTPYLALFAGCVMLTGLGAGTRRKAAKVIKQMHSRFPKSDYCFGDAGFTYYDKGEPIPYSKLIRLVEDREYMYLYISEQSAYMVDKATVKSSAEELKTFLSEKSKLSWERPKSVFNLSFRTILRNRRTAGKDEYTGPRLR